MAGLRTYGQATSQTVTNMETLTLLKGILHSQQALLQAQQETNRLLKYLADAAYARSQAPADALG
jgi:hypothetical protein